MFRQKLIIKKFNQFNYLRKTILIVISFIIALVIFTQIKPLLIQAVTHTFIQTDWSGGADTNSTATEDNLSNWTKFYSGDTSISYTTPGEIKLILN